MNRFYLVVWRFAKRIQVVAKERIFSSNGSILLKLFKAGENMLLGTSSPSMLTMRLHGTSLSMQAFGSPTNANGDQFNGTPIKFGRHPFKTFPIDALRNLFPKSFCDFSESRVAYFV